MQPFSYLRAASLDEALHAAAQPGAAILAGGTTMVDLMRSEVWAPSTLVDIGHLDELAAFDTSGPVLRFGALARMADVAEDAILLRDYPALAQSLQLAASQQLRNAATLGGNLLQRTRCTYFRDGASPCNKRAPGTGCAAIAGSNRNLGVLGTSEQCIATYPGDWGTALAAFDTAVEVRSAAAGRTIPFDLFHFAYADHPEVETTLQPGEVITAITVQATPRGRNSAYCKVRDRESYAYALASAAVAVTLDGGRIASARVAVGGVASKPWRSEAAEQALLGQPADEATGLRAGEAAFADARPQSENAFKIELGRRVVAQALLQASRRS